MDNPDDFVASYFDKKVNEDSARQTLPVNAWRWQRRFFIWSDSQKILFYFKTPDDVPKENGLRGQIFMRDCLVDDLDEKGNPRPTVMNAAVEMQRGDKASLLLRIRSKDPRRPCVKDHNSLVLRAENVSVKYEWIARLQAATGGGPAPSPNAPPAAGGTPSGSRRGSKADSPAPTPPAARANLPPTPPPEANGNGTVPHVDDDDSDVGELYDPVVQQGHLIDETLQGTRLGEGAKFFRAESLRDDTGNLLPAPGIVLTVNQPPPPGKGKAAVAKLLTVQETWETRYDQLLDQFAKDMSIYIRMVCDTIVTTVPKSVVHCLVRKSEKNLLNHLFGYVHQMGQEELKRMLQEDDDTIRKRAAVKNLYDKVKQAIDDVQYMQEKVKRKEDNTETVVLPVEVLALAGVVDKLSPEKRKELSDLIKSPWLPEMRAPVPLTHLSRPNKLPAGVDAARPRAPEVAAPDSLARRSVQPDRPSKGPSRAVPPAPGSIAAGSAPARRAPPPPPK